MEEVSDIRIASFYEKQLRYISRHGRNYGGGEDRIKPRAGDADYIPSRVWKNLSSFGVVARGGMVNLDKLVWCCEHPSVAGCVDASV